MVTGASDGIGRGFVEELAQNGFNVVAMSRNKEKLEALKQEVESSTGVSVIVLDQDAGAPGAASSVVSRINALPGVKGSIRVLVNNVGVQAVYEGQIGMPMNLDFLGEHCFSGIQKMCDINVKFSSEFTALMIPLLKNKSKKERAAIINLSSITALFPAPLLSIYSATKSYNNQFSKCLSAGSN